MALILPPPPPESVHPVLLSLEAEAEAEAGVPPALNQTEPGDSKKGVFRGKKNFWAESSDFNTEKNFKTPRLKEPSGAEKQQL